MRNTTRTGAHIEGSKKTFRPFIFNFQFSTFNYLRFPNTAAATPVYSYTYVYNSASIAKHSEHLLTPSGNSLSVSGNSLRPSGYTLTTSGEYHSKKIFMVKIISKIKYR
jgi:hypothetical protein